jgi:predicted ATPase
MLKSIQLVNFKSFASDAGAIQFAPVTLLVGANGSGKSNLLDAVRFLHGLGHGLSISQAIEGKKQGEAYLHPPLRGGTAEICWKGTDAFSISTHSIASAPWTDSEFGGDLALTHCLTVRADGEATRVASETLALDNEQLYRSRVQDRRVDAPINEPLCEVVFSSGETAQVPCKYGLLQTLPPHVVPPRVWSAVACLSLEYKDYRFLDLRASEMRNRVPVSDTELGVHGESLSSVVFRICKDKAQKKQLIDWLGALYEPKLADIDFSETDTQEVLLHLVERNGRKRAISARNVSDGTLRFLGYLAAFYSAPRGTVFFLEEIENGLHPTRVHLLVELIEQFAESQELQVIATTHSSQVLLSLSDTALRDVVLFARPEDSRGTITRRLGDLPHFEEVTKHTHIDQLFSTGWLEHVL